MAQLPFLTDQIKIEPGSAGTRLINRSTGGDLQFSDPTVTAVLSQLLGLRNVTGLYLVGRAGAGAPYTTIQDALDAIPVTSSSATPSVVALMSGAYSENLVIDKDGICLIGLGGVSITNALADATIKVIDDPTHPPKRVVFQNLVIVNTDNGEECLLFEGAGAYASGTATVLVAPLAAGDTITIGGVPLSGVNGTRTSGSNNFSVNGGTVATIAAEIAIAINDPGNLFSATVIATSSLGVVTLTAVAPGTGGNTITLAALTTPPGNITVSGATLTGGGASGSLVAEDEIAVLDCDLLATGVGGYQIRADTVNNVRVHGGTWRGSSSTSNTMVSNLAAFRLFGIEWVNDLELAYDTGNDQPSILTSVYAVQDCGRVKDILTNLVNLGSLSISGCPQVGDVTAGGTETLAVTHSNVGDLILSDTLATTLILSTRDTASVAVGTPTLAESSLLGVVVFAASSLELVVFDVPQPNANYGVVLDCPVLGTIPQVTVKTATGFSIATTVPLTATVTYAVLRQM